MHLADPARIVCMDENPYEPPRKTGYDQPTNKPRGFWLRGIAAGVLLFSIAIFALGFFRYGSAARQMSPGNEATLNWAISITCGIAAVVLTGLLLYVLFRGETRDSASESGFQTGR